MRRLKDLREDHDLKQSDVAKILGISQQYYQCYECGKYELPLRHCITLAKFYGVSLDYLAELSSLPQPADQKQSATVKKYINLIERLENAPPKTKQIIKILLDLD